MIRRVALKLEAAMHWLDEHMWPAALPLTARSVLSGALVGAVITTAVSLVVLLW